MFLGVLALFSEVVFRGRVFFYGDLSLYFLPELSFLRHELLAGRIPLWNPYINCGQPFVGNPQTWVLYPSTLLLYVFSAERATALSTVLHVFWAGLGMLGFLCQQKRSLSAATLGAAAFAFGGALVSKVQFPNMLQAMSWLPWLLWSAEAVLRRPAAGRVGALALCVGLALLAAHAQVTLMQLYLALGWVLFRLVALPPTERRRPFLALVLAALLGLGLALAQLLPVVEYALASTRPHLSLGAANRFYLPWRELVLLVAPNALGNPALASGWQGKANFWEPCCYIGLLAFLLGVSRASASLRALRARRPDPLAFWFLAALLSLWLALGRYGGLYILAFYLLPGVKQFHDPARWLYLTSFALAVLAAYGLERLRLDERAKWALVVVSIAELVFFSRTLNPICAPESLQVLQQNASVFPERVFSLRPFVGWKQLAPYKRYPDAPPQLSEPLQRTPNLPLWSRLPQAGGYEPVARKDSSDALKALGKLPENPAALTQEQVQGLEALGVRWVYGRTESRRLSATAARITGAQLVSEAPGRLELQPTESEIVVRETFAAGWRAWADGVPVPLISSPPIFMKIAVPAATKRVVFRYEPRSWRIGGFISGGAGCILVALMIVMLRKKEWQS